MTAAAWFASLARDVPVKTADGREIHCRRDYQRGRPLLMWVVGLKLDHIGQTIYRLLFQPGAYKIIQDKTTGAWRAWQPWLPEDVNRWRETRPSHALINPKECKFTWTSEGDKIFNTCTLPNDTKICAYASSGEVKMGDPVDVIWLDEQIWFDTYYAEWRSRIVDRMGIMCWSTMPRPESEAWRRIKEVAQEQSMEVERGDRAPEKQHVAYFRYTMSGNPFHLKEALDQIHDSTMTEEDLAVRDAGDDMGARYLVYPHYDEDLHSVEHFDDALHQALQETAFIPPPHWTHELILDPGSAKPAVLLCAVPPPSLWGSPGRPYYVPYYELYKPRLDADAIAAEISDKAKLWGISFRRFIIDGQMAQATAVSFGIRVGDNYSRAFEQKGLRSAETGSRFTPGSPSFEVRSEVINQWLSTQPTGIPQLRIVRKSCPNLCRQMATNMRVVTGLVVMNKEARQINDVRQTLEYWASRHPTYQTPDPRNGEDRWWEAAEAKFKQLFSKPGGERKTCSFGPGYAA
jgi:hypothetical protein